MTMDAREIANRLFEELRETHPILAMRLENPAGLAELEMTIVKRPGLKFDVILALHNSDELHLGAGELWVSWFPCTSASVANQFRDAVTGLLSGRCRILEYRRWGSLVKAFLQRPEGNEWKTVHRYYRSWPFAWLCSDVRALQNLPA